MKLIDKAIMSALTRNETLNSIIANMPIIADNPEFIETLATGLAKGSSPKWCGTDRAKKLFDSVQTVDKPGFHKAIEKAFLYSTLNPNCTVEESELFVLAIERLAAEPDNDRAEIWLNIAATMLPGILINHDAPDDIQWARDVPPWQGGSSRPIPNNDPFADDWETADKWDSDYCRVCGIHKQATHAPWCEYRDGTPVAEIDRMRLFSDLVNDRLNAVEYRTGSLEAFLDFDPQAPADDREPDCIHDLIAEGMTGVTTDCGNQIAALQERLVAMQARLVALEAKQPLNPA